MAEDPNTPEVWKPVVGYEQLYQVSSLGRVKSLSGHFAALRKGKPALVKKPERVLKPFLTAGYPSVALCTGGAQKTVYLHRLVCEAWHGAPPEGTEVAHNDGDRLNARPENLRWATRAENLADKVLHGTQLRGDRLWFTKLPESAVRFIRQNKAQPTMMLARRFGVSRSHVDAIKQGKSRMRSSTGGAL